MIRRHIILICFFSILLSTGLWIKVRFFPVLTRETTFYFYSLFWISSLLITVFIADLIYTIRTKQDGARSGPFKLNIFNRRASYRITYPKSTRPTLILERNHGPIQRQLEYPVSDISEQGIRFLDIGSLGPRTEIEGKVRFHNGETYLISGSIVRRTSEYVCIQMHHNIPWKTILDEQRRLISKTANK